MKIAVSAARIGSASAKDSLAVRDFAFSLNEIACFALAAINGAKNKRRHLNRHPLESASQARPTRTTNRAPTAHRERNLHMGISPKHNEQKTQRILNAWETLAPGKSFGGMTLAQFQAAVQPAQAARQRIDDLEDQLKQAIADRENADEALLAKAQLVVNGVLADPTEGADSALYEAFGYTRKSERKSGLTRKRSDKPPTP